MHGTDPTALGTVLALPAPAQPPIQYSWWVWTLGLVLLALIALWYWWLFRRTRPGAHRRGTQDSYASVRAEHEALIDAAYDRYTEGESDLRALHLDFNHIIRAFATARTGVDTSSLTVSEFARLEHGSPLQLLLEDYSEPAFAAASQAQAEAAAEQAREVIRTW